MFSDGIFAQFFRKWDMEYKQEILGSARKLFLRYGLKSVTMDDICKEMAISKKTLYQHVDNKKDLIQQILLQHAQQEVIAIEEICQTSENAIEEILNIARHAIKGLRDLSPTTVYDLQKYYRESWKIMEALHKKHQREVIMGNLEKGIEQGVYRTEINKEIVAKLYVGKSFLVVDETLFPLREYDRSQLLEEFIIYHIHGVASTKGLELLKKYVKH